MHATLSAASWLSVAVAVGVSVEVSVSDGVPVPVTVPAGAPATPRATARARVSDLCQRLDDRGLLSPHSTGNGDDDGDFVGQLVQPARQQKKQPTANS